MADLALLLAEVESGLRDFTSADATSGRLATRPMPPRFNSLKVSTSDYAGAVCRGALDVYGISGFKSGIPLSVVRQLRDAMSAPLMIANNRIHEANANLLLTAKEV